MQLALAAAVAVDHRAAVGWARELVTAEGADANEEPIENGGESDELQEFDEVLLSADLLPGWDDDWVVVERERLRQLRLHALESNCRRCLGRGATARAIDVGLRAVAAEPLRESAQRVLVQAHLSEGNVAEALCTYRRFSARLADVLGVSVSPLMANLIAPYLHDGVAARAMSTSPVTDEDVYELIEGHAAGRPPVGRVGAAR
jgi:DNA-binding SARP family transcriptional activator